MSRGEDNTVKFPNSPLPGVKRFTMNPENAAPTPERPEVSGAAGLEAKFPLGNDAGHPEPPPKDRGAASKAETSSAKPKEPWNPYDGELRPLPVSDETPQKPLGVGGPCNYIFAVGAPGSGKSTFQSHLFRYLATCGEYVFEPDVEFIKSGASYHRLLSEWQKKWQTGEFPSPTDVKQITEFRYKVTPNNAHPAIPFGFLEISGEEFRKLVKEGDRPGTLLPHINQFLNNPKIKICFLFICQGSSWKNDDFLFSQFLHYLSIHIERDFKSQCSAILILADPDSCERRRQDAENVTYDGSPLDIERFIAQFTPQTASLLTAWKRRALIAAFSVGVLKDRQVDGKPLLELGRPVRYIAEPSFEDTRLIFNWIYAQFTNIKIGKSPVRRFLDVMQSWGLGGRS